MANPGEVIPYSVDVCNDGDAVATGAAFSDTAPQYTTLVVGSVITTCGTVTEGNSIGDTGVNVSLGDLAPGACCTISFNVQIDDPLPPNVTVIENQGTVTTAETGTTVTDDPDTGTGDDSTETPIDGSEDEISVVKNLTHSFDPNNDGVVDIGEQVTAEVVVCNAGGGTLNNIVVNDPTPDGLELVNGSVVSNCGATVIDGNTAGDDDWGVSIASLAVNACCTITANYTVVGFGTLSGYQEINGEIVLWGTNGSVTAGTSGNSWNADATVHASCNGSYAENTPNNNTAWFNLPFDPNEPGTLCWNVNVTTPGTYYVWAKGDGPGGTDNSIWVGTSGNPESSLDFGGPSGDGTFQWSNQQFGAAGPTTITLAAGQNTICVWPREDGVQVDQLYLTTSPSASVNQADCLAETVGASSGGGTVNNTATASSDETAAEDGIDSIVVVDPAPCPCAVSTNLAPPCTLTEPTTFNVTVTGCDTGSEVGNITWFLDGTPIANSFFVTIDPAIFTPGAHTIRLLVEGSGDCANQTLLDTTVTCNFGAVAAGACVDEINMCLGRGPSSIWKEDATTCTVHPDSNCVRDEMVRQVNNNLWPNLTKWTSPFFYVPSDAAANDSNCPVGLSTNTTNVNLDMSNSGNDAWFEDYTTNFPLPGDCDPDPEGDGHATLCEFKNRSEGRYVEYWRANGACSDGDYGGVVCDLATWNGRMPCDFYSPADPVCDGDLSVRDQGATATSLPLAPGMIMKYEAIDAINNGNFAAIDHGLGLSVIDNTCAFVQPACRTDGAPSRPPCSVPTCGRIAAGYRLRLPPSFNINSISDPLTKAIAYAVQQYGFIVWDKAGAVSIRGELDTGSFWGNLLPGGVGGWNNNFKNQFPWSQLQLCSYPGSLYDFRDCSGNVQNCQF